MTKKVKPKCLLLIVAVMLIGSAVYSQCSQINIIGGENPVILQFDGNGRLTSISGTDEEEGGKTIRFTNVNGISLPVTGQNGIRWIPNGDGNYIITMSEKNQEDEDDETYVSSDFKINGQGKLVSWVVTLEGGLKTTKYTYNASGDLVKMSWEGMMTDTKVTDKGELTATFNTAKPDIIMKGGPLVCLATVAWLVFPMTNSHQITSYTYNQTIHVPETEQEIGQDNKGNPINKTIPAKDIKNVITRNFTYTYDAKGNPASVTVSGKGIKSTTFRITYTGCIKI